MKVTSASFSSSTTAAGQVQRASPSLSSSIPDWISNFCLTKLHTLSARIVGNFPSFDSSLPLFFAKGMEQIRFPYFHLTPFLASFSSDTSKSYLPFRPLSLGPIGCRSHSTIDYFFFCPFIVASHYTVPRYLFHLSSTPLLLRDLIMRNNGIETFGFHFAYRIFLSVPHRGAIKQRVSLYLNSKSDYSMYSVPIFLQHLS